jgi:hypothetical protein
MFLLAWMASAVVGLSNTCPTSGEEPFGDSAGLCLDCVCCPNGVSTFGEAGSAIGAPVSLRSHFPTATRNPLDAPPAEILHIPKPALS